MPGVRTHFRGGSIAARIFACAHHARVRRPPGSRHGRLAREDGQALPLALGGAFALIAAALALVAIAGAVTGKGRAQRAADLAAISAARSMRDDLPRLLSPPTLPNGLPNPAHMEKAAYLARARAAALDGGEGQRGGRRRSCGSPFPTRLRSRRCGSRRRSLAELGVGTGRRGGRSLGRRRSGGAGGARRRRCRRWPAAAATAARSSTAKARGCAPTWPPPSTAWPLRRRGAGIALIVNSAFRSDAEQAALFAAHPDPRWVAPPGHSLHRCATELDLGPESAYGWLAANAARFGFVQRYCWEAWHYGYDAGPPPCSAAGNAVGAGGGGDGASSGGAGLPAFVPARFRAPLLRAAARWNVSAALLAAQLMAESNFNPFAVSPAGAQGIAQFIPSHRRLLRPRDPFDPVEAMDAQAHLMSDLIRQLGSPQLALAAYNAGPAPVEACHCVPAIPETRLRQPHPRPARRRRRPRRARASK